MTIIWRRIPPPPRAIREAKYRAIVTEAVWRIRNQTTYPGSRLAIDYLALAYIVIFLSGGHVANPFGNAIRLWRRFVLRVCTWNTQSGQSVQNLALRARLSLLVIETQTVIEAPLWGGTLYVMMRSFKERANNASPNSGDRPVTCFWVSV